MELYVCSFTYEKKMFLLRRALGAMQQKRAYSRRCDDQKHGLSTRLLLSQPCEDGTTGTVVVTRLAVLRFPRVNCLHVTSRRAGASFSTVAK